MQLIVVVFMIISWAAADSDGLQFFTRSINLGVSHSNVLNLTRSDNFDSDTWLVSYYRQFSSIPTGLKRSKRSIPGDHPTLKKYTVCPPIDGFEIMNYENLACPDLIMEQESKYLKTEVRRILPVSLVERPRVCTCVQQKYIRWCFKKFFDSDEKTERVMRLEPVRGHCQTLCNEMINQGKVELIHGAVPDYSCWWMKGTTVEGVVTKMQAVNVLVNKVTMEVTNQFFQHGKCIWDSLDCRFQGGAYVIFPAKNSPVKVLNAADYSTEVFDYREIPGSDLMLLRSKVSKTVYNVKKCCISYGTNCLAPSIRGYLFDITRHASKTTLSPCPDTWSSVVPPLSSRVIQDPDVRELNKEEMFCHLTKQSILNSVKVGVAISRRLLSVFNDEHRSALPSKSMYYISGKSLIHAKCIVVEYDDVSYHCPDIWVLKRMGSSIACYDARANIAFAAKCQCYPKVSVRYIMNEYVVQGGNGTYSLKPYKYPESDVVEELNLLAQSYKDLLSYVQTPSGVIIYDDPILKGRQEDALTNQTYAAINLLGDFFGWFRNIKNAVTSVGVAVLLGLSVYITVRFRRHFFCCRVRRSLPRSADNNQYPAQGPQLPVTTQRWMQGKSSDSVEIRSGKYNKRLK
ncbi:MAG: glycoprotein [Wufeng shrew rhabdovirus 8]|nr:MAG: glycoprotein [Wufeng shrew rhabdovirus 8]